MKQIDYQHLPRMYWVRCAHCGAEIDNLWTTEEEAAEKWNTRVDAHE